jgi:hypothetical protein
LAERQSFLERKQALQQQPASPQRDAQLREEIQRHQAESKRLSVQQQAARKEVISDLKQKWTKVESDWKSETTRHDAAKKQLEKIAGRPAKTAQIEAENAAHRATSKQIAAQRNVVHEGVINQANRDVMGGTSNASNSAKQTAGTTITDPNHRGMNGDYDAGGGYRTTEKAGKILNEIGVKGPNGGPVKVTGGVLETAPDFGMTVNAAPGTDRIGSAGHQAQVKVGAQHGETYVSETGGSLKPGAQKDHVATMDHAKKALHGTNAPPETLVGGAPEGQMMAKGAIKAANQARLDPEMVKTIAKQNGIKNPDQILDTLGDIKTGRSTIPNAEEAAKLQKTTRDILNAAEAKTKAAAMAEVTKTQSQIADLEAKGMKAQAQQARNELADYNAKAKAATEAVRGPNEPVTKPGGTKTVVGEPVTKPGTTKTVVGEPEVKTTSGGKLMKGAGLALGAYGIYEGYKTAKEEMEAKKQGEPTGMLLAGPRRRLNWPDAPSGMAWDSARWRRSGARPARRPLRSIRKDVESRQNVAKGFWKPYLEMKTKAVLGGLYGGVKAITYDAAKQTGTNLGNAIRRGAWRREGPVRPTEKRPQRKADQRGAVEGDLRQADQERSLAVGAQRRRGCGVERRLRRGETPRQSARRQKGRQAGRSRTGDQNTHLARSQKGRHAVSRRVNATVSGKMDMASGAIEMQANGNVTATAKSKGIPSKTSSMEGSWLFRGSFASLPRELPSFCPQIPPPPPDFCRCARPGSRREDAAQCHRAEASGACLSVRRAAWHGEDLHGAHFCQGAVLQGRGRALISTRMTS